MKKIRIVLVLLVIFSIVFSFSFAHASVLGDMNGDNRVTFLDLRLLLQRIINDGEDVESQESLNGFYVVVSNGVQSRYIDEQTELSIKLANEKYPTGKWCTFSNKFSYDDFNGTRLEDNRIYDSLDVVYVYAEFDIQDKIKNITVLENIACVDNYIVTEKTINYDSGNNLINDYYEVTEDTIVLQTVPQLDEDDEFEAFKLSVIENKDSVLSNANSGIIVRELKRNDNSVKYILLMEEEEESELMVGKVNSTRVGTLGNFARIDGVEYEIDMEDGNTEGIIDEKASGDVENLDKAFILFTEINNKIRIKDILNTSDLIGAPAVIAKSGALIRLNGNPTELDTEIDDTDRNFKNFDVIHVNAAENKNGIVEFTDGVYLGTGIRVSQFYVGDRVVINYSDKNIYIVTVDGCDEKDTLALTAGGEVEIIPFSDTPSTGREISPGDWTVVAVIESSATERFSTMAEGEILEAVENDGVKAFFEQYGGTLTLNPFDTPWEVTTPFDLDEAPTVASRCQISYQATNNKITVTIK